MKRVANRPQFGEAPQPFVEDYDDRLNLSTPRPVRSSLPNGYTVPIHRLATRPQELQPLCLSVHPELAVHRHRERWFVPSICALFATAMLEHQVLRTIDVGRHVLLIAEIRVADRPAWRAASSPAPSRTGRPGCSRCRRTGRPRWTGHRTAATCSRPATASSCWPPGGAWAGSCRCTELAFGRAVRP